VSSDRKRALVREVLIESYDDRSVRLRPVEYLAVGTSIETYLSGVKDRPGRPLLV
jgi:hypothetical protein